MVYFTCVQLRHVGRSSPKVIVRNAIKVAVPAFLLYVAISWLLNNGSRRSRLHMENSKPESDGERDRITCVFGLIADIQYADSPDSTNYSGTRKRYYRNSLIQLKTAVSKWKSLNAEFAIDLGDVIDGSSARDHRSKENMKTVLAAYKDLHKPVYFQWGNHNFYNFNRDELLAMTDFNSSLQDELKKPQKSSGHIHYYQFSPCPGYRIVFLDSYEISMLGHKNHKDPKYLEAEKILRSVNPNKDLNSPIGLKGKAARFVQYNGGLSEKQLRWLDEVLSDCDNNKETVIITSHISILEEAGYKHTLVWNYDRVLSVLHTHRCVAAFFAGHSHDGGYAVDGHGIHHLTLQGVVESPPGTDTFAVVELHTQTGVTVRGYGKIPHTINIPHRQGSL